MGLEFVNCNNFLIKKCETWEELISNYRSTTVRYPSRPMSMPPNNEQSQVSLGILRVCTFHFWRCHGLHVILFDDSHGIFFYWYAILFYILVTETLSSKVTAERLKLAGVKEMWDVGRAYLLCLSPIGIVLSIVAVHTSNSSRALSESASCHVDASERTISEEMVQTNVTLGVLM